MEPVIVWLLVTLVGSFGGSYLGAYFKKKGENLATQEDIGKLVEQVQAVTKATKEIEVKISDEVWNRQRQWEFKRDVLLEAVKKLGACHQAFTQLVIAYQVKGDTVGLVRNRTERLTAFTETSSEIATSTLLLVDLVCGPECRVAFTEFRLLLGDLAIETFDRDIDALKKSKDFGAKYSAACKALRKELRVDEAG